MARIPGEYVVSLFGYKTFIPAELPPKRTLEPAEAQVVEEATHLTGQVEMCRILLPNANLLIYSSLRREALASSTIEGTIASPDELVRYQAAHYSEREAVREVANYTVALEWGVQQLAEFPILSNRLILGLHERLLHNVRGSAHAGRYKEKQNYIGAHQAAPISEALFIPPPPDEVPRLMADHERYLNLDNAEPRIVQCALAHYQFETIHPFHDGNGRVGRLLIILQMIKLGLLSAPLIYPSVYFERHRDDYIRYLNAVREQGAWADWITFFARGIAEQCRDTIRLTQSILSLQQRIREDIGVRRRASINAVVEAFFQEPVLTISQIAQRAHLAIHSAQSAVDELQQRQIVYEITGKQKGRVYACRPVLNVIFGQEVRASEDRLEEPPGNQAVAQ